MMLLRFQRTSPTHHRLQVVRTDGSREDGTFETRSTLIHDLLHFAVEAEAGLFASFFGLLASGRSYTELVSALHDGYGSPSEALATEILVGALTPLAKGQRAATGIAAEIIRYFQDINVAAPGWLTDDFVARVEGHYRRLAGQRKATAFGEVMELRFPP